MATVTASKYGTISKQGSSSWSATRTGTGSSATNQPTGSNIQVVKLGYETSKGEEWDIKRLYLAFDVSSYASGYTITDLKLYYKPTTSATGTLKIAIIKSTAQGDADADLATSDYYTPLDYSVDYADNDGTDIWADSTTLSYFDLNSTAISAFTNSYLKLAVIEYVHDYNNTAPTLTTNWQGYNNFSTTVPYLSFTATATGYTNDIIGVSSANIDSVEGVATANISQIIGV